MKPSTPSLGIVAEYLCIESKAEAQQAKDMIARIAFTHCLSETGDKPHTEFLFLLWLMLDNLQGEM